MKKRVASLQDEVNLLQNTVDRLEERLSAVESRPATPDAASADSRSPAPGTEERPRLRVIRVEPGEDEAGDAAPAKPEREPAADDAEAPRPVIRGTGDRVETELPPGPTSWHQHSDHPTRATRSQLGHTRDRRDPLHTRGA